MLQSGVKMAEIIIKEGTNLRKVFNRDALTQTNMKVSTDAKRKEKLSAKICGREEIRRKLTEKT